MASALFNAIIVLLCVNIVLFITGVRVIDTGSTDNFLGQFVTNTGSLVNETLQTSTSFDETIPDSFVKTGTGTSFFSFIDPIGAIIRAAIFMVNITLTPLGLFGDFGFPNVMQWMIALPLLVIGFLGFLFFVRGVGN